MVIKVTNETEKIPTVLLSLQKLLSKDFISDKTQVNLISDSILDVIEFNSDLYKKLNISFKLKKIKRDVIGKDTPSEFLSILKNDKDFNGRFLISLKISESELLISDINKDFPEDLKLGDLMKLLSNNDFGVISLITDVLFRYNFSSFNFQFGKISNNSRKQFKKEFYKYFDEYLKSYLSAFLIEMTTSSPEKFLDVFWSVWGTLQEQKQLTFTVPSLNRTFSENYSRTSQQFVDFLMSKKAEELLGNTNIRLNDISFKKKIPKNNLENCNQQTKIEIQDYFLERATSLVKASETSDRLKDIETVTSIVNAATSFSTNLEDSHFSEMIAEVQKYFDRIYQLNPSMIDALKTEDCTICVYGRCVVRGVENVAPLNFDTQSLKLKCPNKKHQLIPKSYHFDISLD
jgi:hypothetical protein